MERRVCACAAEYNSYSTAGSERRCEYAQRPGPLRCSWYPSAQATRESGQEEKAIAEGGCTRVMQGGWDSKYLQARVDEETQNPLI